MAKPPQHPPAVDPDHVPETLCKGRFYLTWAGNLGTITFTHPRPKAGPLFGSDKIEDEHVVRARIVMPHDGFAALRDFLNEKIKSGDEVPASGAAGETRH